MKLVYLECIYTFVIKRKEPCEGRLSSTVPWESEGEIPSRDPIIGKLKDFKKC